MVKSAYTILEKAGIKRKDRVICAVSGGIDSICMLHILNSYGLECIVAHCNFQLRGEESNGDEEFVRQLAKEMGCSFELKTFDTEKYAEDHKLSIQMAARELRFSFFEELLIQYKCKYLALGHNSDDQIETVLTNFIRGTGLRGLTGMLDYNSCYIRPLLNNSRDEIIDYANKNTLSFREDSTNKTIKYSRNKLRHVVIPSLSEINPAKKNMLKTIDILKENEDIFNDYIMMAFKASVSYKEKAIVIDLVKLNTFKSQKTVLFEILYKLELPLNLAADSVSLLGAQSGKFCEFENYLVLKDRDEIIISLKKDYQIQNEYRISKTDLSKKIIFEDIVYEFEIIDVKDDDFKITRNKKIALLDFDKIEFPLSIRHKREGDKFKPLGMNNFKKLSDFFVDNKLSMTDKDSVHIFQSGKDICWIAGLRIDNRFKIDLSTKKAIKIHRKMQ